MKAGEAASCPLWENFLSEVMLGRQDLIDLLQEMFGYLISTDTSLQRIFFMFGKKRSGKGTIMRLIHALVGGRNVSSATIKTLGGRFGLEGMPKALVEAVRLAQTPKAKKLPGFGKLHLDELDTVVKKVKKKGKKIAEDI